MGLPNYIKIKRSDFYESDNEVIEQKIKTIINYRINEEKEYKISKDINSVITLFFDEMDNYCEKGDYRTFNYDSFDFIIMRSKEYLKQSPLLGAIMDIEEHKEKYKEELQSAKMNKDTVATRMFSEALSHFNHYLDLISN